MTHAQLKRVEPPFWWSGMHMEELQILLYGDSISDYEVSSDVLEITEVKSTENPNYLFVTIKAKDVKPGEYSFRFKKGGNTGFIQQYVIKKRRENSALRNGFNSSDMIYLLMPDRFANGNPSTDSVPPMTEKASRKQPGGRHGGDIKGIIDHLDYLQDLGVTTLWSTPLNEDNDANHSYHGYAQSDVYNIDPRYGTNEEYRELASELHKKDMKLIMDYVTNHWGIEHWMMKDLPMHDWIHQFPEGFKNTNYRMTTQFDTHTSIIDKEINEKGWFVKSMPDLNQSNPLMLNYLIQNAIWWIEYADLDGLRVDTYSYNEKEGIAKWTKAIMDEYPNLNIVGEIWMHEPAHIAYWQKDSKIGAIQNFNSHLPTVMDFPLHDVMERLFGERQDWDTGMIRAYNVLASDFLYPDTNNLLVFTENHDTQRTNTKLKGSLANYKLATTLLATTRGIPQLYYGTEIGMQGDKDKGDGDIRRDFPGGWEGDTNNAFTQSGRTKKQEEYHAFTKKLFNWRKNAKAVHTGCLLHYVPEENVYIYFRILEERRIMVVLNNNTNDQVLRLDRFSEGLNGKSSGVDILSGIEVNLKDKLKVTAKTPMVIELD
ncbi:glycoside hydrolase family 13 protein [Flavimarina sp. Hel_I_48]|uniref:glycoside hydrolase family 13 protein n=1 Tax=Flavimarina sp. Hel_I_48 TaxID=1392488 RepID=UPI001F12A6B3|nr:glycoside hydrolase family 13 protein [Flavimarina sp. Hel_I_48]